jgi:hypothetical protein
MIAEFTDTNAHLLEAEDGRWDLYDFLTAYGHERGRLQRLSFRELAELAYKTARRWGEPLPRPWIDPRALEHESLEIHWTRHILGLSSKTPPERVHQVRQEYTDDLYDRGASCERVAEQFGVSFWAACGMKSWIGHRLGYVPKKRCFLHKKGYGDCAGLCD